jgi:hypothetical protein
LSAEQSRSYRMIAAAIVIAGVLISASLFVAIGQPTKTSTSTSMSTSTTTVTNNCLAAANMSPPLRFPLFVSVSYSGPWNATLTAYSNSAPAFTQCYAGDGVGYVYLNDWNPNGSALLVVTAQKLDGSSGNLTLTVEADTTGVNLTIGMSSTVAPYGSASASAGLPPFMSIDPQSGPISTFPAAWVETCGRVLTGDMITYSGGLANATSILGHNITLDQVYEAIVNSSMFLQLAQGHGWVVAEWDAGYGGGGYPGNYTTIEQVTALFVLRSGGTPTGYIDANYDLLTGTVRSSFMSFLTTSCPASS